MGLDRSTLGRNLRVLEGDGLLRLTGGEDQRNRLVELTPAGLDALGAERRPGKMRSGVSPGALARAQRRLGGVAGGTGATGLTTDEASPRRFVHDKAGIYP